MRPLPEPMDGEAARLPRSTGDTARIPVMDDDAIGRHEAASAPRLAGQGSTWRRTGQLGPIEPGWYERMRADVAAQDASRPGGPMWSAQDGSNKAATPHYPRHQAAKDDLPGPSRAELARLIRHVRALVIMAMTFYPAGYTLSWYLNR